jgi:hypothetical protein
LAELEKVIKGLECCILHDPDDKQRCSECPYEGNCVNRLKMDALSLLKAQEPRVMTKEEIIGWDGYIWFEFSGMRAMKVVLIDYGMVREPFRGDYPTKELSWETCQETWRAWTAMPTAEQREAAPWAG